MGFPTRWKAMKINDPPKGYGERSGDFSLSSNGWEAEASTPDHTTGQNGYVFRIAPHEGVPTP